MGGSITHNHICTVMSVMSTEKAQICNVVSIYSRSNYVAQVGGVPPRGTGAIWESLDLDPRSQPPGFIKIGNRSSFMGCRKKGKRIKFAF